MRHRAIQSPPLSRQEHFDDPNMEADDEETPGMVWLKHQGMQGLSYLVWSIVAIACLSSYSKKQSNDLMKFPFATFSISAANAVMGLSEFVTDDAMYSLRLLLELLLATIGQPCITTEVWLKYKIGQKELAYCHTGVGLIPLYIYLLQHYTRQDLVDFSVIANVISLASVGYYKADGWAFVTSLTFFFAYYTLHRSLANWISDLNSKQFYNYAMACVTFMSYKTVSS